MDRLTQRLVHVVFTYAKIQIWKRFTTTKVAGPHAYWLCLPMQRYKFESDSQQSLIVKKLLKSCVYLCKDTNLKAIHNSTLLHVVFCWVVFTYAKIQIWKQFTTNRYSSNVSTMLCLPMALVRRIYLFSNSHQTEAEANHSWPTTLCLEYKWTSGYQDRL